MSATTVPQATVDIEQRLDDMAAQLTEVTEELRRQREQRERWQELSHDLAPIARSALQVTSEELEELSIEVTVADLTRLARRVALALPSLEAAVVQIESLRELAEDMGGVGEQALTSVVQRLSDLQQRGYLEFAAGGLGVVDRIVTSFGREDVEALGDNVVLILETIKDMTQPEVMTMLRRTAHVVSEPDGTAKPPTLLSLVSDLRDPDVRRGLARVLAMLRSIGDQPTSIRIRPPK